MRCWEDAARLGGDKWRVVLGELLPSLQQGIAANPQSPRSLAPSRSRPIPTNFCVESFPVFLRAARFASCRPTPSFIRFRRQVARLEEDGMATCTYVPAEPCATLPARFQEAAAKGGYDLVFVSQVFFTSGATSGEHRRPRRRRTRRRDLRGHRWLSRLHGAPDRSCRRSRRGSSTWRADTSTPWQGKAFASCIALRAMARARAIPAGLPNSARSLPRRASPSAIRPTARASSGRRSIPSACTGCAPCCHGWPREASASVEVHAHATALMAAFSRAPRAAGLRRADAPPTSSRRSATARPTATFSLPRAARRRRSKQRSPRPTFMPIIAATGCASASALRPHSKTWRRRSTEWPKSWKSSELHRTPLGLRQADCNLSMGRPEEVDLTSQSGGVSYQRAGAASRL